MLRTELTSGEALLWKELRGRKLDGFKFLRQHPIVYKADLRGLNYFVLDFYCSEKKIAVEIDGPIHQSKKEYDKFRDAQLKELGIFVLRIKNDDLNNIEKVLATIRTCLSSI